MTTFTRAMFIEGSKFCEQFGRIKLSRKLFEKGHPRNIPVKLFQNQTSGSRGEDF